jgi:hypothetical protein
MRSERGVTLPELMIGASLMAMIAYGASMMYFSSLKIYQQQVWRLPPYDAATAAVTRVSRELADGMLIDTHGSTHIVFIAPLKDSQRDNVLTLGPNGYQMSQGDHVAYYLGNAQGTYDEQGTCLWKAVRHPGDAQFVPVVKIADNIHPELNPVDPDTGQPRGMFKYWPDEIRLWGVELWMTSTSLVHGQPRTQTAHSEVYLRNL